MVDEAWDHVVSTYTSRAGLSEICLRLQDAHGVDVVLLLFLAFLDAKGREVSPELLKDCLEISGNWQAQVVTPIRRMRRDTTVHGRIQDAWMRLRVDVKALELKAERLEIDLLQSVCGEKNQGGEGDAAKRYLMGAGVPEEAVASFFICLNPAPVSGETP